MSNLCKNVVLKVSKTCQIMVQKKENRIVKSIKDNWPKRPRVFKDVMTHVEVPILCLNRVKKSHYVFKMFNLTRKYY